MIKLWSDITWFYDQFYFRQWILNLYIILLSDKRTLHNNYSLKGEKNFCENNDKFIGKELNLFSKYVILFNCYIIENYTFDKLNIVLNAIFKTLSK